MDNATRRQLLEQAKQIGYTGSILDVFQNPQILDQFVQEQQTQQQPQQVQQSQPQIEMPPLPAIVSNYKVPQPRQSEAQPLVMSNTEVPIQIRRNGGLKFDDGGPLPKVDPNTNPNQDLTYKDNPEWFDNRAIYSGDDRYDAQIRKLVYEGKASYNPATKVMTFLKPNQQSKVDEITKAYSKDKRTQTAEDKKLIAKDAAKQHILNEHEDFVKKSALATGVLAAPFAASAAPAVMGALEAPMVVAGSTIPGVTVGSTIGAGFGGYGITQLPNTYDAVSEAYNNPTTSNITDAAEAVGVNALDFVGLGIGKAAISGAGKASRYLTTQTPLRNTWKLNPYSNRLDQYNRVVGRDAIDNALESRVIKSGSGEGLLQRPTLYPSFTNGLPKQTYIDQVINQGKTPYIISTNRPMAVSTLGRHGKGTTHFPIGEDYVHGSGQYLSSFPIEEAKLYNAQPHWQKGYEPIEVPKVLPGSTNVSRSIKQSSNKINQSIIDDYTQREINWLNSEEYIKRNMAATGKSRDAVIKEREKILNQIDKTTLNVLDEEADLAAGVYSQDKNNPLINLFNAGNKEQMLNVADHEIKHAVSQQAIRSNDGLIDLVTNPYKNYPTVNTKKWYDYFVPFETTSKWASQAPEQQVVSKRIMDLVEKTQGVKRGTQLTDDNIKGVINLLNTQIKNGNLQNSDMIHMLSAFKSKFGENYYPIVKDMVNKAYALSPVIGAGYLGSELYQKQKEQQPKQKGFVSFKTGGKKCYTCNQSKLQVLYNKRNYKK